MEDLVRKLKEIVPTKYTPFTGDALIQQLSETEEYDVGIYSGLFHLEKLTYTEKLFNVQTAGTKTFEGFLYQFLTDAMTKNPESITHLVQFLEKNKHKESMYRVIFCIQLLAKIHYKTNENEFVVGVRQLYLFVERFYREIFQKAYHETQDLSDEEGLAITKYGYIPITALLKAFIKANKEVLTVSPFKLESIQDYVHFDGEVLIRKYPPKLVSNSGQFLKFVGNLIAKFDFFKFYVDQRKDNHEILHFKDVEKVLAEFKEKIMIDPWGMIQAESNYFEYRKYRVLSLRKDKIFLLHKNIVPNTDQEDENLNPANEPWDGYGGLLPFYLIKQVMIREDGLHQLISPLKFIKTMMHVFSNVPEVNYTGGDYFMDFFQFIKRKMNGCDFSAFMDSNEGNLFAYDFLVGLKRVSFNINPKNHSILTEMFLYVMRRVRHTQTRYLFINKFLDMDYEETFFQTAGFNTGVIQIIYEEIEDAKFRAFDGEELFLRKDLTEKLFKSFTKGSHKDIGSIRFGFNIFVRILQTLKTFNALDWHQRNTVRDFYKEFDFLNLDPIKEKMTNRLKEIQEIIDRKNRGEFTGSNCSYKLRNRQEG